MLPGMGKSKGRRQGIGWERYSGGKPLRGRMIGCFCCVGYPSERGETRGCAGDFGGEFVCVECPLKEKMMGLCREGKWVEKLRKLSFLKLKIMLKLDISRQTK